MRKKLDTCFPAVSFLLYALTLSICVYFAKALASKLPGDLKVVFFTNSGTEANELALLMARLYTSCHDVISIRNGYHGNAAGTMGATAQSSYKFNFVQCHYQNCGDIFSDKCTQGRGGISIISKQQHQKSCFMRPRRAFLTPGESIIATAGCCSITAHL
ncbi:unnamed protein product [Fraxinus pennsylvanica]|uniref:Uncharacterized protein n=1 Tax=Fraxinus pennsylvanica TaxID=56036 RepID=A0AAD1Z7B1_9LAMI|nr:unnamed protein product [Fraxinus pennsylvanica]